MQLARTQSDLPPLATGAYVATTATTAVILLSFVKSSVALAIVVLLVGVALIGAGVVADVRLARAWSERNERQRAWLAGVESMDLLDFRAALLRREIEVEHATQNWTRPLVAMLALAVSTLVVPYAMLLPLSPSAAVGVLTKAWVGLSLLAAVYFAARVLVAAVRQQRADLGRAAQGRSEDPASSGRPIDR